MPAPPLELFAMEAVELPLELELLEAAVEGPALVPFELEVTPVVEGPMLVPPEVEAVDEGPALVPLDVAAGPALVLLDAEVVLAEGAPVVPDVAPVNAVPLEAEPEALAVVEGWPVLPPALDAPWEPLLPATAPDDVLPWVAAFCPLHATSRVRAPRNHPLDRGMTAPL